MTVLRERIKANELALRRNIANDAKVSGTCSVHGVGHGFRDVDPKPSPGPFRDIDPKPPPSPPLPWGKA